jgi:urease accessory protein
MPLLPLFKSLAVVRDVCREEALPSSVRPCGRDTMTLGWEERLKARARRRSDGGREFATALNRGTILRTGDCLFLEDPPLVVVVVEAAEAVFVVRPRTSAEWALFAYSIGNSHQPLMIAEDAIVCPAVMGMEQVLEHHRIPFSRDTRPFTPVAGLVDHHHSD